MKTKIYVRVARSPRFRRGHKIDAAMTYNPQPLTVGTGYSETAIHTAFFALTMEVPDELLRPADLPTVDLGLLAVDRATTVTPVVEQAEEDVVEAIREAP